MRRAASHLAPLALLVFLPSLLVAKPEPTQTHDRGVQSLAIASSLPRASQLALPRRATPVQISPVAADPHPFVKEFYGVDSGTQLAAPPASPAGSSTPISALPSSLSHPE